MKIDDKLLKKMALPIGGLILLIFIIALITSCGKNKKYTFEELNDRLIILTKEYYEKNKDKIKEARKEQYKKVKEKLNDLPKHK